MEIQLQKKDIPNIPTIKLTPLNHLLYEFFLTIDTTIQRFFLILNHFYELDAKRPYD